MLKIRIEMVPDTEEEIVIRCKELTSDIIKLQQILMDETNKEDHLILNKGDTEYFLKIDEILFFETESSVVMAHTVKDSYETGYKLYELEDILPGKFLRISKSSIVNVEKIYSISRNLTASSEIEFFGTHKTIYVSRAYYKILKAKIEEKRYK